MTVSRETQQMLKDLGNIALVMAFIGLLFL
jgi:hypothetical protein